MYTFNRLGIQDLFIYIYVKFHLWAIINKKCLRKQPIFDQIEYIYTGILVAFEDIFYFFAHKLNLTYAIYNIYIYTHYDIYIYYIL